MVNSKRLTRRAALGCLAVGGGLLAFETVGFGRIDANRVASVLTADDDSAYIALVREDYNEIPNNDFVTVASLTNNIPDSVDVIDYTLLTNQDGVSIRFNGETSEPGGTLSGSVSIVEAGAEPIDLECSKPGQIGDNELLTVQLTQVESTGGDVTIEDVEMEFEFLCSGASLEIPDVRGLTHAEPSHLYEAEVDVEETAGETTENLTVTLTIVGNTAGPQYDTTKTAPGEINEISNETITVVFDDIGQLPEDDYEYTVTADADNANPTSRSGVFAVTSDDLPPDLRVVSTTATGGSNAVIAFTLENVGEKPAVIEAISIDDTRHKNQTVTHVEQAGNEFERTDGGGTLDRRLEVPSPETSLDQTAMMDPQETADFRLGAFRRQNGNRVNMGNGSADITLYLDGEPDQQLTLDP